MTARQSEADPEAEATAEEATATAPSLAAFAAREGARRSMPPRLGFASTKATRLLLVRHGESTNKKRAQGVVAEADPGLTELGFKQAEAVGRRLVRELRGAEETLLLACSPMRRCLQTALPLIRQLALERERCICHFGAFEYGCAGRSHAGSSKSEVEAQFPEFQAFGCSEQGTWDCQSEHDRETEEECRLRGERLIAWLRAQVLQGVGTLVLVSHQTISDLLGQILLKGTAKDWTYGDIDCCRLRNAAFTEIFLHPDGCSTFGTMKNVSSYVPR